MTRQRARACAPMAHRSSCRLRRWACASTGNGVAVFESIMSFERPESAESWVAAFESCPNQWKEEGDPDEYITVEPVEIADLGEDAAGFVLLYEHSSSVDTEHSTGVAFVRISPIDPRPTVRRRLRRQHGSDSAVRPDAPQRHRGDCSGEGAVRHGPPMISKRSRSHRRPRRRVDVGRPTAWLTKRFGQLAWRAPAAPAVSVGSEVTVGSCATGAREPGQDREVAAFSGTTCVPQIAWPSPRCPPACAQRVSVKRQRVARVGELVLALDDCERPLRNDLEEGILAQEVGAEFG